MSPHPSILSFLSQLFLFLSSGLIWFTIHVALTCLDPDRFIYVYLNHISSVLCVSFMLFNTGFPFICSFLILSSRTTSFALRRYFISTACNILLCSTTRKFVYLNYFSITLGLTATPTFPTIVRLRPSSAPSPTTTLSATKQNACVIG